MTDIKNYALIRFALIRFRLDKTLLDKGFLAVLEEEFAALEAGNVDDDLATLKAKLGVQINRFNR